MKILHISLKSVYPKIDGGCVAIDNFLQLLSRSFDECDHICIATPKHPFDEATYRKELPEKIHLLKSFFINTKIRILPFVKSLFSMESYQVSRFYSQELADYLEEIADQYDAVILESVFLTPYLSVLEGKAKVFVRTHNVEATIWKHLAVSSTFPKKQLYRKFSQQLEGVEAKAYASVAGLIHISGADYRYFVSQLPAVPQISLPLSVDRNRLISPQNLTLKVGFLGAANWSPNQEAAKLLDEVLFLSFKKQFPHLQFYVAGFGWEEHTFKNDIINLGTVQQVCEFYNQISVLIVPLKSGSGLKIKVVEAIINGKMVIGSELAFEGLEFLTTKWIAKNAADYVRILAEAMAGDKSQILAAIREQQEEIITNFGREALQTKLIDFVSKK